MGLQIAPSMEEHGNDSRISRGSFLAVIPRILARQLEHIDLRALCPRSHDMLQTEKDIPNRNGHQKCKITPHKNQKHFDI
jgi:hypothetical protein